MATIKSFTSLEQSKVLAKILPIESADMYWLNRHIDLTETKYEVFVIEKSNKYIDFFKSYAIAIDNNEIIPCWSLAVLIELLPKRYNNDSVYMPLVGKYYEGNKFICGYFGDGLLDWTFGKTPVDTCYEMIVKLHEQKLL